MSRLFLRIFLWFWLGSTCLLLVAAAGALIGRPEMAQSWRAIRQSAMLQLGSRAVEAYERDGPARAAAALDEIARELRFRVWLYAPDERPIGAPAPVADVRGLIARALAGDDVERASGTGAVLLTLRIGGRSGAPYVFIWESPFRLREPLPAGSALVPLRLLPLILTAGLLCLWLTWYITRPIRTLREAARQFSDGNLAVRTAGRPELRRGDELSELAREFDQMASRIQELVTSQQQLLADISHELRSPLARLSLALDLARRRLGDDLPEHQRIEREIHRLDELIEQLLTLARLQAAAPDLPAERIDLRDLLHQVVQDARFEAEAADRQVLIAQDCAIVLRGHRPLLRSAIENVVRNAVRHTPPHRDVRLTLSLARDAHAGGHPDGRDGGRDGGRDDGAGATLIVRDHGPGVPAQALDRLFDPFYRVDAARDRSSGGVGLGLAITRQAMTRHGGSASAHNHPDGGLVVRLYFPTAHAPDPDGPETPAASTASAASVASAASAASATPATDQPARNV